MIAFGSIPAGGATVDMHCNSTCDTVYNHTVAVEVYEDPCSCWFELIRKKDGKTRILRHRCEYCKRMHAEWDAWLRSLWERRGEILPDSVLRLEANLLPLRKVLKCPSLQPAPAFGAG